MNIFAKPFKDLGVIEKEKGKEKITYIIKINNYRNYKNSKQKHFGEGEKIIFWIRLTFIYRKDNLPLFWFSIHVILISSFLLLF